MSSVPDPKTWATGGDPATEKQKSFLSTLAAEKGESIDTENIEKGPASAEIERLKNAPASAGGDDDSTESRKAKAEALPAEPLSTSSDDATDKQKRYLKVLEHGSNDDDESLTKAEASQKIASLKSENE